MLFKHSIKKIFILYPAELDVIDVLNLSHHPIEWIQ